MSEYKTAVRTSIMSSEKRKKQQEEEKKKSKQPLPAPYQTKGES